MGRGIVAALSTAVVLVGHAAAPQWTVHGPDGGTISAIDVDPGRPSVVYAGTHGAGVFRSADGGRTWSDLTGAMSTTWIASLALDPSGRTLYAGTTAYGLESGGGVFAARMR